MSHSAAPLSCPGGLPTLCRAVAEGKAALVESLLASGSNPQEQTTLGVSAMALATSYFVSHAHGEFDERLRIVHALLAAGPNLQDPTQREEPLFTAARSRGRAAETLASALLGAGADPNRAQNGVMPLGVAATYDGDGRVTRVLLAGGADPNILVAAWPILSRSISSGNVGAFRELLSAGANPMLPNALGELPIEMARRVDSGGRHHFEAELLCAMERHQLAAQIATSQPSASPGPRL